jgi:hypothetical protein
MEIQFPWLKDTPMYEVKRSGHSLGFFYTHAVPQVGDRILVESQEQIILDITHYCGGMILEVCSAHHRRMINGEFAPRVVTR